MEKPPLFYLTARRLRTRLRLAVADSTQRVWHGVLPGLGIPASIGLAARVVRRAERSDNGLSGCIAVLALLGCVSLLERGHFMIADIALLAGFVVALTVWPWRCGSACRAGYWLGTGVGIGFMSKDCSPPACSDSPA